MFLCFLTGVRMVHYKMFFLGYRPNFVPRLLCALTIFKKTYRSNKNKNLTLKRFPKP